MKILANDIVEFLKFSTNIPNLIVTKKCKFSNPWAPTLSQVARTNYNTAISHLLSTQEPSPLINCFSWSISKVISVFMSSNSTWLFWGLFKKINSESPYFKSLLKPPHVWVGETRQFIPPAHGIQRLKMLFQWISDNPHGGVLISASRCTWK